MNAYPDLQTSGLVAGSLAVRHLNLLVQSCRSSNSFSTYVMGDKIWGSCVCIAILPHFYVNFKKYENRTWSATAQAATVWQQIQSVNHTHSLDFFFSPLVDRGKLVEGSSECAWIS